MKVKETKLWTALITPLKNDGSIDYPSIIKMCREQERANNGILVLGSTGESLNLNREEKREIFSFIKDLDLKVPLMAGIGGINLEETLSWLNFIEDLHYDAYLMVTPLYAKPGDEGQLEWFKTLMDKVSKPVMLYNIPGRTGISLSKKALEVLKNHPQFWSIKEASGSPEEFKQYVELVRPNPVYSGDDALLPLYSKSGAKGLVSVASNAWPLQTHQYVEKTLRNELEHQSEWESWSNSLFMESNPIPVKRLLFERGDIESPLCRAPLSHKEIKDPKELMTVNQHVLNWL
jgi:4-hydroxy-tetrahydrodipicolinate synthase